MKVFAENLEFVGRHGVYAEERDEGRLFRIDIAAELDHWATGDEVDDTLDYRRLINIVLEVGLGESVKLIETLGYRIVERAFSQHAEIHSMSLTIRKRALDVAGDPEWVGASFEVDRDTWRAMEG